MKYIVYGCTGCSLKGGLKANIERHARTACGGAEVATYSVDFVNVTRVDNGRVLTPMEQFMCKFSGVEDDESKHARAAFLYTRDAYMTFLDIKGMNLGTPEGIIHSFGRFISLFFGSRCLRDEWRSVWLSDKYIYVHLVRGEPIKYPKDERHKLMVLKHLYDVFEWTLSSETMDIFHNKAINRMTDCAITINNTLRDWSEKVVSKKAVLQWTLKDLVSRRHFKSKMQEVMLSHFEGLFWHFSEYHVLSDDRHLTYGCQRASLKAVTPRNLRSSNTEEPREDAEQQQQGDSSIHSTNACITGYVCDCGAVNAQKSNMERHKARCGMNYHKAKFKVVPPTTEIRANIAKREMDPRLEMYIKIQNTLCHLPRTNDNTINDEICLMYRYDSLLDSVKGPYQVTKYSFMKFFRVYFGRHVVKPEWTRFWMVAHPTGPFVAYFKEDMYSLSVGTFEEKWHEMFSIVWNLYKFLYNPIEKEPPASRTRTFYEYCEMFLDDKQSSDDIRYVYQSVWDELVRLDI
jgi:hypothetical protein